MGTVYEGRTVKRPNKVHRGMPRPERTWVAGLLALFPQAGSLEVRLDYNAMDMFDQGNVSLLAGIVKAA